MTNTQVLDGLEPRVAARRHRLHVGAAAGLPRVDRPLPAGCAYWKHASEGHGFYTTPEDHYGCTVGAFTHNVTLPDDKKQRARKRRRHDDQPRVSVRATTCRPSPHREQPMQVAAYAPLADATFTPDVVVFRGNARQLMLVSEAARSAGSSVAGDILGRPACAMIPHDDQHRRRGRQLRLHRQSRLHRPRRR